MTTPTADTAPANTQTLHGVYALRASHAGVRRLKRQLGNHSAHGNKVWRSSLVMMDYLYDNPLPDGSRVMDLGCGWGFGGIFLAKRQRAMVTAVDIDPSVEPFLNLQAATNGIETVTELTAPGQLCFQPGRFEKLSQQQLGGQHTLIGADICFWDELAELLFKLIRRALKGGCQQIIIADPGRPPFWGLVDRCIEVLDGRHGVEVGVLTRRIYAPLKTEKYLLKITQPPPLSGSGRRAPQE